MWNVKLSYVIVSWKNDKNTPTLLKHCKNALQKVLAGCTSSVTHTVWFSYPRILHIVHIILHTYFPPPLSQPLSLSLSLSTSISFVHTHTHIYPHLKTAQSWLEQGTEVRAAGLLRISWRMTAFVKRAWESITQSIFYWISPQWEHDKRYRPKVYNKPVHLFIFEGNSQPGSS